MSSRSLQLSIGVIGAVLGIGLMMAWMPDTGPAVQASKPVPPTVTFDLTPPEPQPIAPRPRPQPVVRPAPAHAEPEEVYVPPEDDDDGDKPVIPDVPSYHADVRGIARVANDEDEAIQECFQAARQAHPEMATGQFLIKFSLVEGADGKSSFVEDLGFADQPDKYPEFEDCLASIFDSVAFRAPSTFKGEQEMRWPMLFE